MGWYSTWYDCTKLHNWFLGHCPTHILQFLLFCASEGKCAFVHFPQKEDFKSCSWLVQIKLGYFIRLYTLFLSYFTHQSLWFFHWFRGADNSKVGLRILCKTPAAFGRKKKRAFHNCSVFVQCLFFCFISLHIVFVIYL